MRTRSIRPAGVNVAALQELVTWAGVSALPARPAGAGH